MTGKPMRKLIALSLIAMLAGCATVDGVGRDISGAARGVQSWF
jgi:predicted small secreted protein